VWFAAVSADYPQISFAIFVGGGGALKDDPLTVSRLDRVVNRIAKSQA
jgi:hypothetical protein